MLNTYKVFDVNTIVQYKIYKYINEHFEEFEVDIDWASENEANVRFLDGTYMKVSYYNKKIEIEFQRVPDNIKTIEQFKIYKHIRENFHGGSVQIEWLSGNKSKITDINGDAMILMCKGKEITVEFDKECN